MSNRWNADKLMGLSAGFLKSRILITAAELGIFAKVSSSPRSVEQLCAEHGWDNRGLRILLDALTAMELLKKTEDGRYATEESASRWLSDGEDRSVLPMILHRGRMWKTWSNLTEVVKTGGNPGAMDFSERSDEDFVEFIAAMHVAGRDLAGTIAESVALSRFRRMLDVGGGSGVYLMAFLERAPHMTGTLFDLPQVAGIARDKLTQEGYIDRVEIVTGDYTRDPLPSGHDLVLLSAIIHINSRERNRALYAKVHQCLEPGGAILIRDHVMDPTRTDPPDGAIFAVNMLVATDGGGTYTFDEIREDLESVGFKDVHLARQGRGMDKLVAARKPAD